MKYIAYYRVSTIKQGTHGLGMGAQRDAVANYTRNGVILAHYEDVESGKSNTREGLNKAIQHCKNTGATLCIAKLDRLSRNVQFVAALMESKVKFVCCDMPDASDLTIHIFAAMAQWERERISTRIKDALKEAKARGIILGNPANLTAAGRSKGAASTHIIANNRPSKVQAVMIANLLRKQGCTIRHICYELNTLGMLTPHGKPYAFEQTRRLLAKPA